MPAPQLTKGMYTSEFGPPSNLFGLRLSQQWPSDLGLVHNGGWYNKAGEELGWGDLGLADLLRISGEIADGEFFVILGEKSVWDMVAHPSAIGDFAEKKELNAGASGADHLSKHARFIIGHRKLYFVDNHNGVYHKKFAKSTKILEIDFEVLSAGEAKRLLAS